MTHQTVEDSFVIDALRFAREGWLTPGYRGAFTGLQGESHWVTLCFHVDGEYLHIDSLSTPDRTNDRHFAVELTITRTVFGVDRLSFVCVSCGRVVDKLYLPPGASTLGCRLCHSLSYQSRQRRGSSRKDALFSRASRKIPEANPDRFFARPEGVEALVSGMETETPPRKRPPGRPKEKRAYERRRPFLTGERQSDTEGLCLRCRAYRELAGPQRVTLPNGRSALRGTCPACGAPMMLIIKKS